MQLGFCHVLGFKKASLLQEKLASLSIQYYISVAGKLKPHPEVLSSQAKHSGIQRNSKKYE